MRLIRAPLPDPHIRHAVPYLQADRPAAWIAWQCLGSVASRVLLVWIYVNTGRSVLAVILFHATINLSAFLFPSRSRRLALGAVDAGPFPLRPLAPAGSQ